MSCVRCEDTAVAALHDAADVIDLDASLVGVVQVQLFLPSGRPVCMGRCEQPLRFGSSDERRRIGDAGSMDHPILDGFTLTVCVSVSSLGTAWQMSIIFHCFSLSLSDGGVRHATS